MRKSKGLLSPQERDTKQGQSIGDVASSSSTKTAPRNRAILGTAIRKLPNCRDFEIELQGMKPLAELFGIELKETPIIRIEPWMNRSMNKYLENEVRVLLKFRPKSWEDLGDPVRFWGTAKRLMKSDTYLVASLARVLPNWHRDQALTRIVGFLMEIKKLVLEGSSALDYKRVYIPKGETWRPLGVPTIPWRVYLHMWNNIFSIYLEKLLPEDQHGFRPGRGTLTA